MTGSTQYFSTVYTHVNDNIKLKYKRYHVSFLYLINVGQCYIEVITAELFLFVLFDENSLTRVKIYAL